MSREVLFFNYLISPVHWGILVSLRCFFLFVLCIYYIYNFMYLYYIFIYICVYIYFEHQVDFLYRFQYLCPWTQHGLIYFPHPEPQTAGFPCIGQVHHRPAAGVLRGRHEAPSLGTAFLDFKFSAQREGSFLHSSQMQWKVIFSSPRFSNGNLLYVSHQ